MGADSTITAHFNWKQQNKKQDHMPFKKA